MKSRSATDLAKGAAKSIPDFRGAFFIVGAAKCGTTSLAAYLSEHPDIFMSPVKEPHYFSNPTPLKIQRHRIKVVRSMQEYERLFAKAAPHQIIGEASPSYLPDLSAAARIHACRPDAKIIAILRDPVERAYSHYLMDVREGVQRFPFRHAIQQDLTAQDIGWGRSRMYVELGRYGEQLERYVKRFPERQLLILEFEELAADAIGLLERITDFLEIGPDTFDDIGTNSKHNAYAAPRSRMAGKIMGSRARAMAAAGMPHVLKRFIKNRMLLRTAAKPPMDPSTRTALEEIYRPEIERVEQLVGRPLPSLHRNW